MPTGPLPRYFVADAGEPRALPQPQAATLCEAVDVVTLGDARGPATCAVVRDLAGRLLLCPEAVAQADATLKPLLVHAEIARGAPPRFVQASSLWLFVPGAAELPEDGEPAAAPIQLLGTLHGPFGPGPTAAFAIEGRLTVRRGDWLLGLLRGHDRPFALGRTGEGHIGHALLPGGDPAQTVDGKDLVLAYPLFPSSADGPLGNGALVAQWLEELLHNLQAAVRAVRTDLPFAQALVPVADRGAIEARLVGQGFAVRGDQAVRDRLFVRDDVVTLPQVATLENLLDCGRSALEALLGFGYPDTWARALHGRVGASAGRIPVVLARPAERGEPAAAAERPPPPRKPSAAADWMADFAELPRAADAPKIAPRAPATTPPPARRTSRPAPPAPAENPDWMKDFE
ncbi:MAG: hypothetical protein FJ100_04070 [Deltaproteobacteria bacterium]|nr:hypothetical protein [Deltaproteobacteria bacterium]